MSTPPSAEWEDEDSSGAVAAGWNKDDDNTKTLSATSSEWELANEVNLENKVKVRCRRILSDLVRFSQLVLTTTIFHFTDSYC